MGKEQSRAEREADYEAQKAVYKAQFKARMEARKAELLPAKIREYQSWKDDREAKARQEQSSTTATATQPTPFGSTSTAFSHNGPLTQREKPAVKQDLLSAWQPRKEPLPKPGLSTIRTDGLRTTDSISASTSASALSASTKRPNAFADERRPSKGKKSKQSNESASDSPATPVGSATFSPEERPPEWYKALKFQASRGKNQSNADNLLSSIKSLMSKCKIARPMKQDLDQLRTKLHQVAFVTVTGQLLRNNNMLSNDKGLPQIFDTQYAEHTNWPFDIKADAEELYNKWCRQVFETDLLRGIVAGKPKERVANGEVSNGSKIDPTYEGRVLANYHGNGLLLNGQWWPTLLCAVRDGAHGATVAGIHGRDGEGAYSCFISGGGDYPDEDHGDWVLYCGTDGTDGVVSEGTRRLLESEENRKPVRFIRSSKAHKPWAPELGFRYDGLYRVVSHEEMDGPGSERQRHRFRLERLPGQDPIRGTGPEKRPTEEEVDAYKKDKRMRGMS